MNTLQFLLNLEKTTHNLSSQNTISSNRMNSVGEALELHIKNIFAGYLENINEDNLDYSDCFSYTGNKTNSPDLMLKNGDAIEIKKIEGIATDLALNSSNLKDKLYASSSLITDACRKSENWTVKDMLYVIGSVKDKKLSKLWLVYGDCYCAETIHI